MSPPVRQSFPSTNHRVCAEGVRVTALCTGHRCSSATAVPSRPPRGRACPPSSPASISLLGSGSPRGQALCLPLSLMRGHEASTSSCVTSAPAHPRCPVGRLGGVWSPRRCQCSRPWHQSFVSPWPWVGLPVYCLVNLKRHREERTPGSQRPPPTGVVSVPRPAACVGPTVTSGRGLGVSSLQQAAGAEPPSVPTRGASFPFGAQRSLMWIFLFDPCST